MKMDRRAFLRGVSAVAAAAVVRANLPPEPIAPGAYVLAQPEWVPRGWLLLQGQELSRAAFPRLFAVLGEQFGSGDGVTTFNLPDFGPSPHLGPGYFALSDLMATDEEPRTDCPPGTIRTFAVHPERV